MRTVFNSFKLEADTPVQLRGSNSLFSIQNDSNATVTLYGSTMGTSWSTIIAIPANSSTTVQTAFKFLKASGALSVTRSISGTNDKVKTRSDDSSISESRAGNIFWTSQTHTPASGKFAAIALWNPVDSGKDITINTLTSFNGAAGTVGMTLSKITSTTGGVLTGVAAKSTKTDSANSVATYYKFDLNAAVTTPDYGRSDVTATTPPGSQISISGSNITIAPGTGLLLCALTADRTFTTQQSFTQQSI